MPGVLLHTLRSERINPLARMLPLQREQMMVYRLAEKIPPGLEGFQPRWQVLNAVVEAQQTVSLKIDLPNDFHLLAVLCSATQNTIGGFRAQFYDSLKRRRLQDRGIQFPNLGGATNAAFFLREPYPFDLPRSQVKTIMQNLETAQNTIQVVFYGLAAPFEGDIGAGAR